MNKRDTEILRRAAKSSRKARAANKRFSSMTRLHQRVAVAKDVLKLLKAKRAVAARGSYMELTNASALKVDDKPKLFPVGMTLKQLVQMPSVRCEVCGIGAIFMAAVACRGVNGDTAAISNYGMNLPNRGNMLQHLYPYFTEEELNRIELFFEDTTYNYLTSDAALRAVMDTIISSKGVNVVPSDTEASEKF